MRCRSQDRPARFTRTTLLVPGLLSLLLGCGEERATTDPAPPRVFTLERLSTPSQTVWSGRRAEEPLRVRALGAGGEPLEDAEVTFTFTGEPLGLLTQRTAITGPDGSAQSWVLQTRPGNGRVVARSGVAEPVGFDLTVRPAPASMEVFPGTGEIGLPGLAHPDSSVRVRLLDTEGEPLPGWTVWFATGAEVANFADTTDGSGVAGTVIRRSDLEAGEGLITAFVLDFFEANTQIFRPTRPPAERVLLVSIDGLRGDALERWAPPTLNRLASEGAHTTAARTVRPSFTIAAHLSMFAGVEPERHGNFSEQLSFTPEMAELDPIFRFTRDQGGQAEAFMSGEGPLAGFEEALQCRLAFGLDSLTLTPPESDRVVDAAIRELVDPERNLVFLHLPEPDLAGHGHGFESPQYGAAVLRADRALERVVQAIDAAGLAEGTLLIVTSDHGGGGDFGPRAHGSGAPDDLLVPLILRGPGVVPGRRLGAGLLPGDGAAPVPTILDIAPTISWALGYPIPGQYEGRVLLEGFRSP